MLAAGLVGTALMLGVGAVAVSNAPSAGPGEEASWPAGETASFDRIPGERNSGDPTVTCTLTPEGRLVERGHRFTVGEPVDPDFAGTATVTCDQPVALVTGTSRIVADHARGPLVVVPMFVAALGVLLFVPRFTLALARLSTSGWLRRLLRAPPPG
ncbi:hypothetical protein [Actinophytocola xanthii]|uniref:Ig-like domain-containing protein n=1 Tax=Actinophytocola xanthii TaxID=1912961 RepID=A0A1Q8CMX4_9PSEU|nr:hypothetical protein [Actinophytocola xanthii]OLF15700.1 hypothetical protein BU204_19975 [Actinophytocola xanthii]